jgi:hypothetical protein
VGWDRLIAHHLSSVDTNAMPMFEGASGVTLSGGEFNDVSGDMIINDSSSHTTNHGSFNTTNETYNNSNHNFSRNDFSRSEFS